MYLNKIKTILQHNRVITINDVDISLTFLTWQVLREAFVQNEFYLVNDKVKYVPLINLIFIFMMLCHCISRKLKIFHY